MTDVEPSYRGGTTSLVVLALAMFVVGTNAFVIAGLLPDIAAGLGTEPSRVSYSITAYSLVVAVASPVFSVLLARVPRAALMAAGLAVFAIGAALAAAAGGVEAFIAGRVLAGVGGAALVPTATAAAATLVPPHQRGRAIAAVAAGFSLATALGSPVGTALGELAGWRTPLWILVGLAVLLAVAILLLVRGVPAGAALSFSARLAPLRRPAVLAMLMAAFLVTASFNVVYIFSSQVTAGATGGSGLSLSVLLLGYGVAGVIGSVLAGPLTDRAGSRPVAAVALAIEIVALAALVLLRSSFAAALVVFVVWGLAAFAVAVPVQHRLVELDPASSAITLSWYSTAMYVGIGVAPLLGSATLATGGAVAVPVVGAVAAALALAVFLAGSRRRQGALAS